MNHSQRQARLVNQVRKLLELSRCNNNAHEAGLALVCAQKLMARYDISDRPAVAAYVFDVLSRQLKEATAAYMKNQDSRLNLKTPRAHAGQFRAGWVQRGRRVIVALQVTKQEWLVNQQMGELQTRMVKACRGNKVAQLQGYQARQNAILVLGRVSDES